MTNDLIFNFIFMHLVDLSGAELAKLEPWAQQIAENERNPDKPDEVNRWARGLCLLAAAAVIALTPLVKQMPHTPPVIDMKGK